MNTFEAWAARHPQAAAELLLVTATAPIHDEATGSEAYSQQRARLKVAQAGGFAWRNNVGATPSQCPACLCMLRPIRYGLANDSMALNAAVKSSDLIGIVPRLITGDMVGTTIGQFLAIECKRPGWHYTGQGRELQQQAYLALVISKGGAAMFSTGEVSL